MDSVHESSSTSTIANGRFVRLVILGVTSLLLSIFAAVVSVLGAIDALHIRADTQLLRENVGTWMENQSVRVEFATAAVEGLRRDYYSVTKQED